MRWIARSFVAASPMDVIGTRIGFRHTFATHATCLGGPGREHEVAMDLDRHGASSCAKFLYKAVRGKIAGEVGPSDQRHLPRAIP